MGSRSCYPPDRGSDEPVCRRLPGLVSDVGPATGLHFRNYVSSMDCAAVREFKGVHNMIRGLTRLMESAVAKANPKDARQMRVLADFGTFAVTGTHFHHSGEDDY